MTPDEAREVAGRTIDLSARAWGQDYDILEVVDNGQRLKLAVWSTPSPTEGDYLILADREHTTRYQVASVGYVGAVRDMTFVEASFAPRILQENRDGE